MSVTPEEKTAELQKLAEGVWLLVYPLHIVGSSHGRVVTLLRLSTGKLIIHSSGPFSPGDIASIRGVGEPGWLVEANLLHDTFAQDGVDAFPDLPYLAPPGFAEAAKVSGQPLLPAPTEWAGEVDVLEIEGMPRVREHVFFHRASRTLVVGDLLFNFEDEETTWERLLRRHAMGLRNHPDVNRVFAAFVRDRPAFDASLRRMLAWDFERVVVGHKHPVTTDAKRRTRQGLKHRFSDLKL